MNRKLATDIDRALKEVAKGVEQFDEIYEKVVEADTTGKKEKAEMELKTQIKKLQRTRDQIKGWIASEEIREKDSLLQARRIIETRMEQFKRAEKEAKTKAFSKEGLAQADKLDPEEQARQECRDWVNESLEQIREQKEAVTADLEALQSKKGKKNKEEMDEIQEKLRQSTWHVHNLELVLRGLDNDVLDYHDIDSAKDEVEYYVTSNGEPDFVFDDSIYEALELESKLGVLGKEVVGEVASGPVVPGAAGDDAAKEKAAKAKRKQELDAAEEAAKAEALERKTKQDQLLKQQQERQRLINEREEARKRREQMKKETEDSTTPVSSSSQGAASAGSPTLASSKTMAAAVGTASAVADGSQQPGYEPLPAVAPPSSAAAIVAKAAAAAASTAHQPVGLDRQKSGDGPTLTAAAVVAGGAAASLASSLPLQQEPIAVPNSVPSGSLPVPWPSMNLQQRLALFDASFSFLPKEVDSERSRMYVPQNPFSDAPPQFPVTPAPRFESSQVFERMDVDSLFFVFFHQPGTFQQFLAAKELKRHDWRFHKQYNVWIQRHEDPTVVTNEFELGTYVYFDQNTWNHRIKTNFTVEYSKLEA